MTFLGQALHVFKNDTRRFALPLLGIGFVMAAHIAGYWPGDGVGRVRSLIPVGLLPLALGALAAVAVQRDSPFDDQAFWTTRPVDPSAMLAAKLGFVALLIAVPIGIEAVWFVSLGAGRQVLPMLLDSTLLLSVVVCAAAGCGAMTRSLRGGLASALGVFVAASFVRRGVIMDWSTVEPGVRVSQVFLERTVWVALGIGLVGHQYLTRDSKRSLGIVAATILVALPLMRQLRVDIRGTTTAVATPVRSGEWAHAQDLELHLVSLRVDQHRGLEGPGMRDGLAATIAFEGGSGAILSVANSRSRVIGVGSGEVISPEIPEVSEADIGALGWRFFRPSIEGMVLAANRSPTSTQTRAWIAVDDADAPGHVLNRVREGKRLELEVDFDAFEPRVVASLDVRPESTVKLPDGGELVVHAVESSGRTIRMEVGHRWRTQHLLHRPSPSPLRGDISFALKSRQYNEFIMDTGGSGGGRRYSLTGGAVLIEPSRWLEFEARFAEERDGVRLPTDWFQDVELVVLEAEYAGSFTKKITREIPEWPTGPSPLRVDGYPPS